MEERHQSGVLDAITRHSVWLETDHGWAAACVHFPPADEVRRHGVVICPPFGYEYTHSHRSLVHLADALASAGFVSLRLDYLGTGDSEGDPYTDDLVVGWVDSVHAAASAMSSLLDGAPPTLIGLRFGSLIAGLATARLPAQHFVGWHPVYSGRAFLREHEALTRFAQDADGPEAGGLEAGSLEAGGFLLAPDTAKAVRAVDLRRVPPRLHGEALLLERNDLGVDDGFAASLSDAGVPTRVLTVEGYLAMMAEPQYTVVPDQAIEIMRSWLIGVDSGDHVELDAGSVADLLSRRQVEWSEGGQRISEEHAVIPLDGGLTIRGVLAGPAGVEHRPEAAVVLANSGAVHHVGPHRFYVELARELSRSGVASLRLDLRNLGESRVGACADENHPYPDTAVRDVQAALDWLTEERGARRLIVTGLCSGAHTAFHAGLDLPAHPIAGVICINPLTFRWVLGMSLDTPDSHRTTKDAQYYARTMRSLRSWLKLLRGQADLGYIVRFVFRRIGEASKRAVTDLLELVGLREPGELARELSLYASSGRPLRFVFSSTDPGHAILMAEGRGAVKRLMRAGAVGITAIEGADHTFSKEAWRRTAVAKVVEEVGRLLVVGVPTQPGTSLP